MKVADFLVECLIKNGVKDVFGLPGEVILEFLYSLERHNSSITAHICYHEQAGALAACGYAQAGNKLGVAYATKGPGILNMTSVIQDAFCDSIPVVFVTAHESKLTEEEMRFRDNQEFDTVRLFSTMTKYAAKIDNIETAAIEIETAIYLAQSDRPGPVLLDISSDVLSADVRKDIKGIACFQTRNEISDLRIMAEQIIAEIQQAKRPVILYGDGIIQAKTKGLACKLLERLQIPAVTSRFSQEIIGGMELNFGYIGSHATRYSNTILMNSDLILSLGNRLSFNPDSKTFGIIAKATKIIRVDIDTAEFARIIPNSQNLKANLKELMPLLVENAKPSIKHQNWVSTCNSIREVLSTYDRNTPVLALSEILKSLDSDTVLTSDVGNNEFWLSRAYTLSNVSNQILFSKSLGLLGCSIPKAIGAQIAIKTKVISFVGDQGFQMNMQELQFISTNKLPILIVVLNNKTSGMILSKQKKRKFNCFLHTTEEGGYFAPPLKGIAEAFSISYYKENCENISQIRSIIQNITLPCIFDLSVAETEEITPHIPLGNICDEFSPPTSKIDKLCLREMLNHLMLGDIYETRR